MAYSSIEKVLKNVIKRWWQPIKLQADNEANKKNEMTSNGLDWTGMEWNEWTSVHNTLTTNISHAHEQRRRVSACQLN